MSDFCLSGFLKYLSENSNGVYSFFNINPNSFSDILSLNKGILLLGSIAAYSCIDIIMCSLYDKVIYTKVVLDRHQKMNSRIRTKKIGNK